MSAHVEAEHEHHGPAEYTYQPNPFKLDPTTLGLVIFLTSEIALFGAFFLFYGHSRLIQHYEWPQPGFEIPADATSFNTMILIASSFTCEMVVLLLIRNMRRAAIAWLVLTIVLGSAFLGLQALEYMEIGFTPATNAMGSTFFSLTGLHGAHVFIGITLFDLLPDPADPRALLEGRHGRARHHEHLLALRRRGVDRPLHARLPPAARTLRRLRLGPWLSGS